MDGNKHYLGTEGLIRLVANLINKFSTKEETNAKVNEIQSSIDDTVESITSGDVVVKEAEHATSADSATTATTAGTAANADHATNADTATNANHANTADSATNASHADAADSATKATKDGSGNVITETYQTIAAATSQHNALQSSIDGKVPSSRTINGKALSGNITLSADDVSAYSKSDIDSKVETLNTAINGKEASGTAANAVSSHNTNASAHNDIRDLISGLTNRLNAVANSTDTELDTLAEIVAYIKSNKSLIEEVTTKKVNVSDIINNLETNVTNKPLSAAQGVAIKSLIDALENSISSAQSKLDTIESGAQVNVNPDWNENDPSEDSYIANRPFYTGDPVLITVVDNVTFTTSDYNGLGSAQNPFALTLEEGIDYVVTWNGTDYTTTCTVMDGLLAIGNGSIFGMAGDTGEPFLIGYSGSIMLYATSIGSVTITIKRNDAEVHKINPKYIDMPNGAYVGESTGTGEIFNDYENNVASGSYSHAEGSYTEASGHWSHAEGYHAKAYGRWSHAEGYATKARGDAQHVQGKFNIEDTSKTYAHIVGNGISDNSLSNAHTLDWDGNAWYAGTVKVGGTSYDDASEVAIKSEVQSSIDSAVSTLNTAINGKANSTHSHAISEVTNLQSSLDAKANTSDLTSHINNKSNPHGVTLSQLGVTATAAELNYVDGVTSNVQAQLNKKADDYTLEIYNGTGGNPKPVRFMTVNYSTCGSENGVAVKLGIVSGHGNGSSYAFLEDAIIKVTHTGVVQVDNFKYYGAETGTYDGANRQYGDIFWVIDTTNKIVDFYCLMGQYARMYQTPFRRVTYSTGGTITQYTNCTVYSSGEKNWGNNSEIALMSDMPTEAYINSLIDAKLGVIENGSY